MLRITHTIVSKLLQISPESPCITDHKEPVCEDMNLIHLA